MSFFLQVSGPLPDLNAIKSVQRLSWAAGVGMLHLMQSTNEEIHKVYEKVIINYFLICCFLYFLFVKHLVHLLDHFGSLKSHRTPAN